ncbi:MAG: DUF3306 domain-containing protein [Tateyamaria sp.]|uniref:DUF3306 domain-containing protein n=1 Tax=Tateyamaria sp. TaxID=1929288 RepID=UPI00329F7671
MSEFGSSWARRRAAVAAEQAADDIAAQEAQVQAEQAALEEKTDAEILEELDLPDPDSMVMGDDFKVFMAKTVPAHIRKRALRTLWRSNPVLACVDGLNDYDDDYLTGSTGQGVIKTGYQVGKGMLSHLLEMERQKEAAEAEAEAREADERPIIEVEPTESLSALTDDEQDRPAIEACATHDAIPEDATPEHTAIDATQDPKSLPPRRMRFQFEEHSA